MTTITAPEGLEGVVVASTVLSDVDGEGGRLVIRGLPVEALAGHRTFEEVAALLWEGLSPGDETPGSIRRHLGAARALAYQRMRPVLGIAAGLSRADGVRLCLQAAAGAEDAAPHHVATAAICVAAAALGAPRPVPPDPDLGHAEDFLRMLHGRAPESAPALEAYLATVSDHGMNASTFAARVVASTGAGAFPAVVAALCALQGPLHGGAPGPVLDMLDAIGTRERVAPWMDQQLAQGRRLMGFGHRIYRVRDPRADVLRGVVEGLQSTRLDFAREVEAAALDALRRHKPHRPLQTNVEFYTALLLEALGIDRALFTPVFAMGRVLGWTAHVFEQERRGRLLRPASRYVGP